MQISLFASAETDPLDFYNELRKALVDELDYPLNYDSSVYRFNPLSDGKSFSLFLFETRVALIVKNKRATTIQIPSSLFIDSKPDVFAKAKRSITDKDSGKVTDYVYELDDAFSIVNYFEFMRKAKPVLFRELGTENMTCCNDYERCSDAKKCLHYGDVYYNRCYYRINLESDHVFYGRNRNT